MNRAEPPVITHSRSKPDPLKEVFSSSGPSRKPASGVIKSPPPRFRESPAHASAAGASAFPGGPGPASAPHVAEAAAFNRSEMAAHIRQSFDSLVKASPIGVPLMSVRGRYGGVTPASAPHPFPPLPSPGAAMPTQHAQQQPFAPPFPRATPRIGANNQFLPPPAATTTVAAVVAPQAVSTSISRGAGAAPSTLFGGGAAAREGTVTAGSAHTTANAPPDGQGLRRVSEATPTVAGGAARQQQQQLQQTPAEHTLSASFGNARDAPNRQPSGGGPLQLAATAPPQPQQAQHGPPASAPPPKRPAPGSGTKGRKQRSFRSPVSSTPHLQPAPATMPVKSAAAAGAAAAAAEAERSFEVTRFGRPRVKPLAYWSSERLVHGFKGEGATGIDRGSIEGDLLGARPGTAPATGAVAAAVKRRGGGGGKAAAKTGGAGASMRRQERGRGRGGGAASVKREAVEVHSESEDEEDGRRKKRLKIGGQKKGSAKATPQRVPSGSRLAALAAAAGAEAAAAAAAAAGNSDGETPTPPPAAARALSNPADAPVPPSDDLPQVPGVSLHTMAALAATPPAQRSKKCGECKPCLNPSMRKACLAVRALGGNPPIPRKGSAVKAAVAARGGGGTPRKKDGGRTKKKEGAEDEAPKPADSADTEEVDIGNAAGPSQQEKKQQQQRKRQAEAPPPPAAAGGAEAAARRSTRQRTGGDDPKDVDSEGSDDAWTSEQVAALHRGWLEVAPTAPNFWQLVAAMVPGRTATECFNKMFDKHPTPKGKKPPPGAAKKLLEAAPPKVAGKQPTKNAARKAARQQRWAERVVGADKGDAGRLAVEMEEQQLRDRYIDQILRKSRGRALGGAAPHRAAAPPKLQKPAAGAQEAARDVQAALAAGRAADRDEDEDSDYYWSDAE